jgi:energy-coupling factor transporter ATP-binding protein EcfA2
MPSRSSDTPEAEASGKKSSEEVTTFSNWTKHGGRYRPTGKVISSIPPGIYGMDTNNEGWYIEQMQFPSDALLRLPGMPIEFILDQINTFWQRGDLFKNVELLHKRGILLYGPAGCGKTSIIRLLCNDLVKNGGIVLVITNCRLAENVLRGVRQIEPNRPILTIIEDIETFMTTGEESSSARALLAFLDGETQVNHVVHLATTNKPDQLEDRIVKRPGRFDLVIELLQPVYAAREMYLRNILKDFMTEKEFVKLVKGTEGLGLAHLRELVVATYCLGLDIEETLNRLKGNMKSGQLKITKGRDTGLGFNVAFAAPDAKEDRELVTK